MDPLSMDASERTLRHHRKQRMDASCPFMRKRFREPARLHPPEGSSAMCFLSRLVADILPFVSRRKYMCVVNDRDKCLERAVNAESRCLHRTRIMNKHNAALVAIKNSADEALGFAQREREEYVP